MSQRNFQRIKQKPKKPPKELAKKRLERQNLRDFLARNTDKFTDPRPTIKRVTTDLGAWDKEASLEDTPHERR